MAKTILYIMTTSVRGLVKLGKTTPDKYDAVIHDFSVNGYKNVFGLKPYYKKSFDTESDADGILLWLEKYRVGETELYTMSAVGAKDAFNPKKWELPFNMYKVGIKDGDILTFVDDPSIKVKVVGNRQVEYKGGVYSLSQLGSKLYHEIGKKPRSIYVRGSSCFAFNGTVLTKLLLKNQ